MENIIEFKVWGPRALFTDPITRVGGEKCSYPIPTYQALKGICESIYWKPTIIWHVDKVRIMNPIKNESINTKLIKYGNQSEHDLSITTYLYNVCYIVRAHFEWNQFRPDLEHDRNENKHYFQAKRALEKGGRRDIFLGTRECQAYVEPCCFGEGDGAYDKTPDYCFGIEFHGFDYGDENGNNQMVARFWRPHMEYGIVNFIRPEDCSIRKFIKEYRPKLVDTEEIL